MLEYFIQLFWTIQKLLIFIFYDTFVFVYLFVYVCIMKHVFHSCCRKLLLLLLLQEPWDQCPLVSISCHVMSFHLLQSWAKLFSSRSPVIHQLAMSSIHSIHGLPLLLVPSTILNISVFNFLLSSILHVWPNSRSFLWIALVADLFQFWVFHIFHGLFFTLSNWYVGSFGNASSLSLTFLLYVQVSHQCITVLNTVVSNIRFLWHWWCSYFSKYSPWTLLLL